MKGSIRFVWLVFLASCSLRDYMNQRVLKDVYDGPAIFLLSPQPGTYSGSVPIVCDLVENDGLGQVEILYEEKKETIPLGGVTYYHLNQQLTFSFAGWKRVEVRAYNRRGIRRSVAVDIMIQGPWIFITNSYASQGYIYTSTLSLGMGGTVVGGPTNLSHVYVRVKRPSTVETISATFTGNNWSCTIPLNLDEDIEVTAIAKDETGIETSTSPIKVYQDSQGPHHFIITSPTNNQPVPPLVIFKGKAQDNKSGVRRIRWTTDNWASSGEKEVGEWLGMKEEVSLEFEIPLTPGTHTVRLYAEDFLGNCSTTNVLTLIGDPSQPFAYLGGPSSVFCTNATSVSLYGEYVNATSVEYSLNGGVWSPVDSMGAGYWTNHTSFVPNQTNTFRLRAFDGATTNFSISYRFCIDTIPPQVVLYTTAGNPIVNNSYVGRHFQIQDNLSGIRILYDKLYGKWGVGGTGYLTETTTKTDLGVWYQEMGGRNFPFGAVITNELIMIDRAGNVNTYSRSAEVYPAIFVTPSAGSGGFGIASDPISLEAGMTKAKTLGIRNVYLSGDYTLSVALLPTNDMTIVGGLDSTFTNITGHSKLKKTSPPVIEVRGVWNVLLFRLHITESGTSGGVSPLLASNASLYLFDTIFSSNRANHGSAISAWASQVGLISNLFISNTTGQRGVFVGIDSLYFGRDNQYTKNSTFATSGWDAQLLLLGGWAVVSNHTFSLYGTSLLSHPSLIHVYAKDMTTFLLHNSSFDQIQNTTNGISIWLSGTMNSTSIRSNTFLGPGRYLMVKEGGWSGYELRNNVIKTNGYTYLWGEFLSSQTNLILSNELVKFNTPTQTKATADSIDNVGF